jgi:hypothetical protein
MREIILLCFLQIIYGSSRNSIESLNKGQMIGDQNIIGLQTSRKNIFRKRSKSETLRQREKISEYNLDPSNYETDHESDNVAQSRFTPKGRNISNFNTPISSPKICLEKKRNFENGPDYECQFLGIICCIWLIMLIAK